MELPRRFYVRRRLIQLDQQYGLAMNVARARTQRTRSSFRSEDLLLLPDALGRNQRQELFGATREVSRGVLEVRCRGLWAGVDVDPELMTGRELCEALLTRGVLAKDTHGSTIRLAPPLVATEDDIEILLDAFRSVLTG